MAINTNLNQAPYFDDFDEDKNFHRVLFKPSVAVQARELTQLQSILQNQIERFGENILKEGTIVKGGNFRETRRYAYAKILDNNTEGQPVALTNYVGLYAQGQTTGVIAKIEMTYAGLESQTPDLNTLYMKYLKSNSGNKRFQAGEILDLYETYSSRTLSNRYNEENQAGTLIPVSLTVATTEIDSAPIGNGYATTVSEGILFQKGNFTRFDKQTVIVSKYTTAPDEVVVGFKTNEDIIDSNNDTSLLDNANGYNNFNAPGADRLKLTPILVTYTLDEADADENFFAILEYDNGRLVRRNSTTQFNSVAQLIEQRTAEESGNYSINQFKIGVQNKTGNSSLLEATAGAGVAYVEGKRIEVLNKLTVDMREGTDTDGVTSQDLLANYGSYIEVNSYVGTFDFDPPSVIDLYDTAQSATTLSGFSATGTKIGEAHVRAVTRDPGSNTRFRIYLFNIKMNSGKNFRDVKSVVNGTSGAADLILVSSKAKLMDPTFKSMILPIGKFAVKTITGDTDYIHRAKVDVSGGLGSSGGIDIDISTISAGLSWPYSTTLNSDQIETIMLVCTDATNRPAGIEQGDIMPIASATVSGDVLNIQPDDEPASGTTDVTVYVNVKRVAVNPTGKELQTVYIKIDGSTYPNFSAGNISLGLPDVFEIEGIWRGSNYSESNSDVTNSFKLYRNDNQEFYGISYIKKRRRISLSSSHKLLIKAKVFKPVTTGGTYDQSFFSVDSYPVDDANTANTSAITTQEIPTFRMPDGTNVNLRDTIDFRPVSANNVAYSTTISGATVYTNSINTDARNVDFGATALNLIAPNEVVEISYDYYLGRKDRFFIDEKGQFVVIEGEASEDPVAPNEPNKGMTLAVYDIPPYPSLTSRDAALANKADHSVKLKREVTQGYTMKDIGEIEQRIDRLEYYAALSALETSAKDLTVTDANGLDRFKNGILVDNFENLAIANVKDDTYNAGIDRKNRELIPPFRKYALDLVVANTNNVTDYGEGATLPKIDKRFINQRQATSYKNCTTSFYNYEGQIYMYPEYDGEPEVTIAPAMEINIDLATPFIEYTEALGKFIDLTDMPVPGSTAAGSNATHTWTTTQTQTLEVTSGKKQTEKVGDFITDVNFSPFLRSKDLRIRVDGLRPNTRFYFFFDGQDVNQHVARAKQGEGRNGNTLKGPKWFVRSSKFGKAIYSDDNGRIRAFFRIPEGQFFVGDRELLIVDVDDLNSIDAATSSAKRIYNGFNFSYEKAGLEATTRMPVIDVKTGSTGRENVQAIPQNTGGGKDPIAQTFRIDPEMSADNALQLTKIDLYFKEKSSVNGINVMIRTTDNGYPGMSVLPFGLVHLDPEDVNVSDDASVATTVIFETPITLKTEREYAIVILPDANDPDYLVWTAKAGLTDVRTGRKIVQDSNPGTLFTSTNNSAWTPYQDENLTFAAYKARYTAADGLVTLSNANNEFFTCNSYSGTFRRGERVFVETANTTGTLNLVADSRTITGSGTTFTAHTVGDWIVYYDDDGDYQPAQILSIANNTSMVVNRPSPVDANTTGVNYFVSPTGKVDYFDANEPVRLVLEDSSARSATHLFSAGDNVIGTRSGASAVIESVDNVSFQKAKFNIYRNNFTKTVTNLSATTLTNASGNKYNSTAVPLNFNQERYFDKTETVVMSRSNEITDNSGNNSFELQVRLRNINQVDTSPVVDHEISSMSIYEYIINNDTTNENTNQEGEADVKYISRTVELEEQLDAEDLKVWLTGYRPKGTDIKVYAKFKNEDDVTAFENLPWTELARVGRTNFTSSLANRFDYKEFEYYLNSGTATSGGPAVLESGSFKYITEDGTVYTDYKYFAVKIVLTSTSQNIVPRVRDYRALALT